MASFRHKLMRLGAEGAPGSRSVPDNRSTGSLAPQGLAPQGLAPQGLAPQGLAPHGLAPHGLAPHGLAPQGLAPQGLAPQGLAPQGLAPHGLAPQGLAQDVVKALRAGLETLGRPPGGSAAGVGDVPWANVERLETACGPLFRRRQIHPVNTRIGSVCLGAALDADVRQLSLLGLEPSIASHDVSGALFVDTETTGLGGSGCLAFLVGLAWFEAGSVVLDQYVLTGPQHERAMLETVRARIARASYLVSYNGKSFDVPMLATRWIMNRIKHPEDRPHLDLLHLVRRVHRERTWRKTLKSAEQHVLGFDRGPDVGGAEVAERYQRYLHNGNSAPLEEVMRHNAHDVMSLVALVGMYGEPLQRLDGEDLASAARVFQRAGDLDCAAVAAERALSKGGGAAALRARGFIAKANGDKRCALADFEAIAAQSRDLEIHLELAKLYEHFCREPRRALETIAAGTTENALAHQRRTRRLQRKCARLAAKC